MRSWLGALLLVLSLVGCTPSYTVDSINKFSQQVGVVDYFEISRWHHHVVAQDSRLAVAAQAESSEHAELLARAVDMAFSRYYADVAILQTTAGQRGLIDESQAQGYDFLIRSELLSAEPAPEPDSEDQSYKHLQILLTVVDVNSALVVDKLLLSSSKARIPFVKGEFDELLHKPLNAVARELSGVQ